MPIETKKFRKSCPHCNNTRTIECPHCSGQGSFPCFTGTSWLLQVCWCAACNGTGMIPCPHCCEEPIKAEA